MRAVTLRVVCAVTIIAAGLAVPLAGTASATDISKPVSANAPALKLTFAAIGDNALLDFSGLNNQVVKVTTSAGTYAANCDVMVSVLKKTTTVAGPVCGGIAGTTGDITLASDATYTIKVDTQGHTPATVKVALTSTGAIHSITPNAAAVTFAVPASATTDFGFIAKAGQRLSALVADGTVANTCQITVTVIAPDGTTVLGTATCAGNNGFIDAFNGVGAGTYKLRVANSAAPTGTLKLQVFQFKDKTASIVANGAAVTGKVAVPGQGSSLTFAGTSGQKISYQVTAANLDGFVDLYRPNGTYAGHYIDSTANAFSDAITLDATGTWSLVVNGYGPAKGSATVKLYTFTDIAGGAIVANGAPKSLTLTTPGQRGSFTFSGTNGQKISFLGTAGNLTGYVELHKPDGSYAGTYINSTANSFSDDVTLNVTGTWSLVVLGVGANVGSVTVQLYTFTDVDGGTIVANGTTKSLTIATPGQNGSFTFSGTNGQKISFKVTASDLSGYVELHKPDGSYAGTYANATVNAFADAFTLNVTGTWSLVVDGIGTDLGSVTVQLYSFTDVAAGTITPGGANKVVTIATPGQNGTLTFSGTNGDSRTVQVTASTISGGYVEFHRPDGSYAGAYSCLTTGCTSNTLVLNVTGTWTILVDPSGPATGSATIKLT